MNEPTRYRSCAYGAMIPDPTGPFVRYDDYAIAVTAHLEHHSCPARVRAVGAEVGPMATNYRIKIEYDCYYTPEGANGKPLPEPRDSYEQSPYMDNGVPVPYSRYLKTFGDPDNYTGYVVTLQHQCECCGSWIDKDSVGGCEVYQDFISTGVYPPDSPQLTPVADVVAELMR